jgi:hypothetical protein
MPRRTLLVFTMTPHTTRPLVLTHSDAVPPYRVPLNTQRAAFNMLEGATSPPAVLSHVRLLDIVAWTSKGVMPSEAAKR